jgi:hypothetical protein
MSHDVDWCFLGPPKDHILARKDRFDEYTISNIDRENPYNNIHDYITIEEKFGLRSTFFFRTIYENGKLTDYEDDIRTLFTGGWEIGLHCDPYSVDDFGSMLAEKKKLESITKNAIVGNRSHYLAYSKKLPFIVNKLGFLYDSSVMRPENRISANKMGYTLLDRVIEFPITLMDAYLFTYMHLTEDKIINTFVETLNYARKFNSIFNVITVIWHANVLKMKGGRKYADILEYLSQQEDVKIVTGMELANIINANSRKVKSLVCH